MSGDLSTAPPKVDLLIVGAGLSGAVLAERCSKELGMTSVVIDKRDHIGGNCYDYVTPEGIRASKYGAHLFHTKFPRVWEYVQRHGEWIPFDHRVKGRVADKSGVDQLVPIPPTQETVNALFDANVTSEEEMQAWYDAQRVAPAHGGEPANGEEAALSRVGPDLYEKIFKHYTKKQWDKYPEELDASVLMRLPCRTTTDDRYFGDEWQALPARGYTRVFENMLLGDPNVTVRLNCDFFAEREAGRLRDTACWCTRARSTRTTPRSACPSWSTDRCVSRRSTWRSRRGAISRRRWWSTTRRRACRTRASWSTSTHPTNHPVCRRKVTGTLIAREYSTAEGEPYYPVPNPENRALYEKYAELAAKEPGVCFVGRLASYKYFNMDQAVLNALEMFDNLKETGKLAPKRRPEEFGPGDGPK